MGLLASVHALVDSEGRTLDELFATPRIVTDMRSNTAVDAF